jgi:hypothetical protein
MRHLRTHALQNNLPPVAAIITAVPCLLVFEAQQGALSNSLADAIAIDAGYGHGTN